MPRNAGQAALSFAQLILGPRPNGREEEREIVIRDHNAANVVHADYPRRTWNFPPTGNELQRRRHFHICRRRLWHRTLLSSSSAASHFTSPSASSSSTSPLLQTHLPRPRNSRPVLFPPPDTLISGARRMCGRRATSLSSSGSSATGSEAAGRNNAYIAHRRQWRR